MKKVSLLAALVAFGSASALGQGIFQPSYNQTTSFNGAPGALEQTSMNLTYDGRNYWSASGGGSNGNRLAQWDGSGNHIASYQPGIDMRSVFTVGGSAAPVYCRGYSSPTIMRQTSPGVFTSHVTLSGGTLDGQSQVEFNSDGSEFVAHVNGQISRWNLSGAFLGNVSLSGYGTMFSEGNYPQYRGIVCAGGYYLTYSNGNLSAWDASGTRVGNTVLTGAGTSFDSHFSLSWANGMIWIIDIANGTWRGYRIPELLGGFLISLSGPCPGQKTLSWSGAGAGQMGIVIGNSLGAFNIPSGPCQGTQLGIQGNLMLYNIIGTQGGQGQVSANVGNAACGKYIQCIKTDDCSTSNAAGPI